MDTVSNKLIERLTLYHCILTHSIQGKDTISSFEISSLLRIDDSLVRKDIASCGVPGRPKYGYKIDELKKAIENKLSFREKKDVFIIGAGNLGTALTKYSDFKDYGIDIIALFDNNQTKIGRQINGKTVFAMDKLQNMIKSMNIKTIILTVPPKIAQKIADEIISYGIRFIWNFTPCVLHVPENVTVHYENIISGFLQMKNKKN